MSKLLNSLFVLCVFLMFGCSPSTSGGDTHRLPVGSTNIVDKGNGWYTFELDGKKFLYQYNWAGYRAWSSITEISGE